MWIPTILIVIFVVYVLWQIGKVKEDIDALRGLGADIEELETTVQELEDKIENLKRKSD